MFKPYATSELEKHKSSETHDLLTKIDETLEKISGGQVELISNLRNRINAERRLIRLERARNHLDTWTATKKVLYTISVMYSNNNWAFQVDLAYKSATHSIMRVANTEIAALEKAMCKAAIEIPEWIKKVDIEEIMQQNTALLQTSPKRGEVHASGERGGRGGRNRGRGRGRGGRGGRGGVANRQDMSYFTKEVDKLLGQDEDDD
jgi:hypothetical protein